MGYVDHLARATAAADEESDNWWNAAGLPNCVLSVFKGGEPVQQLRGIVCGVNGAQKIDGRRDATRLPNPRL